MSLQKAKIIDICDKIILFSLYGLAYFLPISKALIEILSITAILFYVLKKFIQWEDISKTPLNLAIFVYLIICVFSIFISSNPKISMHAFYTKTIQSIAFFFVVAESLNSYSKLRNFIIILFISSTLLGVDGIFQYFTHKDFIRNRPDYGLPRIHATFPTSNDFGAYLMSVFIFTLTCFFAKFRFKHAKILLASLSALLFICLILTVSRGAWLGFLSAALFLSLWIHSSAFFVLAAVTLVLIAYNFYEPLLKERLRDFFIFKHTGSDLDRRLIWQAGFKMFMSSPWLGVGLGTFMFNFPKFINKDYQFTASYAHNCYLQMASEIGIVGLSSFLLIILLFFYSGIKAINKNSKQRTFFWYVLLASLAAILGYCVQMAVETIFYSLDLGMLFWLVLGLGVAAMKNIEIESSQVALT